MASWTEFEAAAPELAEAGRSLMVGDDGVAIGFVATVARDGRPRLAPVCPIFHGDDLYLSTAHRSPKRHDLANDGRYVLHAFLGPRDDEFQVAGRAWRVEDPDETAAVHGAIRFSFKAEDPIFRLLVERCLWGYWENVGQPDTRPVRRRWREADRA